MGLQEKLRERVQPFLQEGEQVQQVFPAMTGISPWLMGAFGAIGALLAKQRVIAATDRRILVLRAGKWSGTTPQEVLAELPRSTTIDASGGLFSKFQLNGETMYVNRRFKSSVEALAA